MNHYLFQTVPALILAGGLGTRLRSVDGDRPKPMVLVREKPFLYWLVKNLEEKGFREFIFSVGYKAEVIENFCWKEMFPKSQFLISNEESPLGTGGAVQKVFKEFPELKKAWVVNGDTLLENPLLPDYEIQDDVLYTALDSENVYDAKPNLVVSESRVIEVNERGSVFDGGQVFISRQGVEKFKGSLPCSFHTLIEPSFRDHKVGYVVVLGTCFDIGTPERLKRFENYITRR